MRHLIAIAVGSLTLFTAVARGGDITVATDPITVTVEREPINTADPIFRAFLTIGENKFTFLLPEKLSTAGDAAHGRLQLKPFEGGGAMTLNFLEGSATHGVNADTYREFLAEHFPGGKIVNQFSRPVNGKTGTAFDIEWTSGSGLPQTTRAIYFPTTAGIMELTSTSGRKNVKQIHARFNEVLGTLTASENGKLVVHHLQDKN